MILSQSSHLQEYILDYVAPCDLIKFGFSNQRCSELINSLNRYWRRACEKDCTNAELISRFPERSFFFEQLRLIRHEEPEEILSKVVSYSSLDREVESPVNVLKQSKCAKNFCAIARQFRDIMSQNNDRAIQLGIMAQIDCGCCQGQPCYWSSSSDADPNNGEWITFSPLAEVCIVRKVTILPYCAFWQPDAPSYAPTKVQIHFVKKGFNEGEPYFSSEAFAVENKFVRQEFELNNPALFLGGEILMCFVGKQQRQTLGEGFDEYYICIAEAMILGHAVEDYEVGGTVTSVVVTDISEECDVKQQQKALYDSLALSDSTAAETEESLHKHTSCSLGDLVKKNTFIVHHWLGELKEVKMFYSSHFVQMLEAYFPDISPETACMMDSAGNNIEPMLTPREVGLQENDHIFLLEDTTAVDL